MDEPTLWEMLYHAIYVPPGEPPPPREIVRRPELRRYVDGWGRADDIALIAESDGRLVGAAWLRLLAGEERGYGFVDERTPEMTMALLPAHRGQGVGTQLISRLLAVAARRYPAVSLSVTASNQARRLYERYGFIVVQESGGSLTMIHHFGVEVGRAGGDDRPVEGRG